ncbi:hypothetical protein Droror1_Dr00001215 [Drosera rotundifolia]
MGVLDDSRLENGIRQKGILRTVTSLKGTLQRQGTRLLGTHLRQGILEGILLRDTRPRGTLVSMVRRRLSGRIRDPLSWRDVWLLSAVAAYWTPASEKAMDIPRIQLKAED